MKTATKCECDECGGIGCHESYCSLWTDGRVERPETAIWWVCVNGKREQRMELQADRTEEQALKVADYEVTRAFARGDGSRFQGKISVEKE